MSEIYDWAKHSLYFILTEVPVALITEKKLEFPFLIIKKHNSECNGLHSPATKTLILSSLIP